MIETPETTTMFSPFLASNARFSMMMFQRKFLQCIETHVVHSPATDDVGFGERNSQQLQVGNAKIQKNKYHPDKEQTNVPIHALSFFLTKSNGLKMTIQASLKYLSSYVS